MPTALIGPALRPGLALLPADLLAHFEPWRSQTDLLPRAYWDPLVWDGIAQYYPWRLFAAETLRQGLLPLWNPYQFCGTPFIANGQSAVFYPLNFLFWVLPVARAFAWSAWLHLVLTGWFSYLFARRSRVGRLGAVSAAAVWQGNGFFVAWMHLPTVLCTAAWLPLVLLLLERSIKSRRLGRTLTAGAALGTAHLAGHPQIFLLLSLLAGAYLICRGLSAETGLSIIGRLRRLVSTGFLVGVCAAGIAAVQLLPTLSFLQMAHRTFSPGPESYAAYLSHAMPWPQFAQLLLPHAFGHPSYGSYLGRDNYAEFASYVGIAALVLAMWGGLAARRWHKWFFTAAFIATGLIVLGTPVNAPIYHWIPGFERSGGPGRFLLIGVFSLSMLAGIGADAALKAAPGPWKGILPIVACSALLGGATIGWHAVGIAAISEIEANVIPLARAEIFRAIAILTVFIGLLMLARSARLRSLAGCGLVVLLIADLAIAAKGHLHISPLERVYPPISFEADGQGRILGNARDWPIDRFPIAALPPNSATVYHLRDAFGYDSLYLARFRDFAAALQHGDPSPPLNGNMLLARLAPVYGLDMMSLAAVERVISPVPAPGLKMERAGGFYVYSNPYAMPRSWVAKSAIFAPTHIEALISLAKLGPLPDCIIITGFDMPADEWLPEVTGELELHDLSPNAVMVRLPRGGGGGYLFLADAYAPGWRAYADGLEVPILPANVAFRVVAPPQRTREVIFRYEPAGFRIGLFITLLTLALLASVASGGILARWREDDYQTR